MVQQHQYDDLFLQSTKEIRIETHCVLVFQVCDVIEVYETVVFCLSF